MARGWGGKLPHVGGRAEVADLDGAVCFEEDVGGF